jgi:hypothetical protein
VHGYASLGKEHGHTPRGKKLAVVRRWRIPLTGRIRVIGMMGHRNDKGDGVHATIWAGKTRLFSERQKGSNRPYGPMWAKVNEGEYIDFVVTPGENDSFDSFFLRTQLNLVGENGQVVEADSVRDFSGPFRSDSMKPLDRLGQLAQVLLMSNEFAFVD